MPTLERRRGTAPSSAAAPTRLQHAAAACSPSSVLFCADSNRRMGKVLLERDAGAVAGAVLLERRVVAGPLLIQVRRGGAAAVAAAVALCLRPVAEEGAEGRQ